MAQRRRLLEREKKEKLAVRSFLLRILGGEDIGGLRRGRNRAGEERETEGRGEGGGEESQREPSLESKMLLSSGALLEERESFIYPGGLLGWGGVAADDSLCVTHTFNKNLLLLFPPPSSLHLHLLMSAFIRRSQR